MTFVSRRTEEEFLIIVCNYVCSCVIEQRVVPFAFRLHEVIWREPKV
jgi:hypothetical protein